MKKIICLFRFVVKEKVNMDITKIEKDNKEFDIDSCEVKKD